MLNENLKRLRVANKFTQQEVAEYLTISPQSISKWEKGEALPSVEFLPKLAQLFHCSVNAFFSAYEMEIFEKSAMQELSLEEMNELAWSIISALYKKDGDEEKEALLDEHPELSLSVEAMFLPALVELLKETDSVGTAFLQRELKVGYYVASQMITALENLGIIVRENGKQKVVKQKIPLLKAYIKE